MAVVLSIQVHTEFATDLPRQRGTGGKMHIEHVEASRVDSPRDLTDALLKTKKEAEDEDTSIKGFLSDQHLMMTMGEIAVTGTENTVTTLC